MWFTNGLALIVAASLFTGCQTSGTLHSMLGLKPFERDAVQTDVEGRSVAATSAAAYESTIPNQPNASYTMTTVSPSGYSNEPIAPIIDYRIPSELPAPQSSQAPLNVATSYQPQQQSGHAYPPQSTTQYQYQQHPAPAARQNTLRQQQLPHPQHYYSETQYQSIPQHQAAPTQQAAPAYPEFRSEEAAGWLPQSATEMVVALNQEVRSIREELLSLKHTVEFVKNENVELKRQRESLRDRIAHLEQQLNATRSAELDMRNKLDSLQRYMTEFSRKRKQQIRDLTNIVDLLEKQMRENRDNQESHLQITPTNVAQ